MSENTHVPVEIFQNDKKVQYISAYLHIHLLCKLDDYFVTRLYTVNKKKRRTTGPNLQM